jgi:hypothetical protein
MSENISLQLDESFDWIIHQLTRGNTIEGIKNNRFFFEFEQVKEWKSKYGFQFQIYPNDHFIEKQPHFHLVKKSDDIECRILFDGTIYDYKGSGRLDKKTIDAIEYFLESQKNKNRLIELWNQKNPSLKVDKIDS